MRTIDKIITPCGSKYGAQMGRSNIGKLEDAVGRVYDCAVPMIDGAYDKPAGTKGGAYWGLGTQLRVSYDKGLNYVKFYRADRGEWLTHEQVMERVRNN